MPASGGAPTMSCGRQRRRTLRPLASSAGQEPVLTPERRTAPDAFLSIGLRESVASHAVDGVAGFLRPAFPSSVSLLSTRSSGTSRLRGGGGHAPAHALRLSAREMLHTIDRSERMIQRIGRRRRRTGASGGGRSVMKRIGILTAGGDTPALNATIHGAVARASQRKIEVFGFIKGFSSLFNPRVPHVHLNPLFTPIPELDMTRGGTLIGASRDYVDADDTEAIGQIVERLQRLQIEGLICIGGDGTLNGMQALSRLPAHRAGPQDHRQRPRPELPPRARRMGRASRASSRRATATSARRRGRASTWNTWSTTSRPATPRPCSSPPRASSASAPPPRATAASPSSRSWAGTPATSPSAPPTASPTSSSSPNRRSTSTGSSSASWRSTSCKRTWSSSAPRASWTRRARNWAPRSRPPTRPATRC